MADVSQEPKLLHKYMSLDGKRLDRVLNSLRSKTLWFSSPTAFNDPFDFAPALKTSWDRDEIVAIERRLIDKRLCGEPELAREAEFKRVTDVENLGSFVTDDKLVSRAKLVLNMLRAQGGVLSLSDDPLSILMWSHYANNHTGLVMSFSRNFTDIIHEAVKVIYVKERPVVDLAGNRSVADIAKMLLYKADYWSYENEWRSINTREGEYSFNPSALVAITFGQFTRRRHVKAIKRAAKKSGLHPAYGRAVLHHNLYRLELIDA